MIYIYADRASASARLLSTRLKAIGIGNTRLRGDEPPKFKLPILNWGCSSIPYMLDIINPPGAVKTAISKVETCLKLQDYDIPCVKITRIHLNYPP